MNGREEEAPAATPTASPAAAPTASPTFTGTVTVPTPIASSNTTVAASTQYVTSAITTKANDITSAYQTYVTNALVTYSNSVNTLLTAKSGFDSPIFTGVPQAPTASAGTNNTQIATISNMDITIIGVGNFQISVTIGATTNYNSATYLYPSPTTYYTSIQATPTITLPSNFGSGWVLGGTYN